MSGAEINITIGGSSAIALKKLYGDRLATPLADWLEIQPIGRGETSAFKGE